MDVQEVRKLDAYLKRVFGNQKIRVVPQPKNDDVARVYIGEEDIGELVVDDEDDDRSFQFNMTVVLDAAAGIKDVGKLDAYFKQVFGNSKIRVAPRPKKHDSAEVYIGEEFIGVLFAGGDGGDRSFDFNMAILEDDLVDQE